METDKLLMDSWLSYYHEINRRLSAFYTYDERVAWLTMPHPQLDHKSAREIIDCGDEARVLEIIDKLEST